jgi:acetoacetyl-CoA synthase
VLSPRRSFGIVGLGSYLPEGRITNRELARSLDVSEAWIVSRTEIHERRVARPEQATSDLATEAAIRALDDAEVEPSELDLVVVATSTPDWIQPATACAVQRNLDAPGAAAFDVSAVCSGFVYALTVADALLRAGGREGKALVIGAETYSRILDYRDRRTCVLFGDGAGAVVLGPVPPGAGLLRACLGSDGAKWDLVGIPAGGSRLPVSAATVARGEHYFRMQARGTRAYVKDRFPHAVGEVLRSTGLRLEDVDLVVPHQANGVLLRECAQELDLPPHKIHWTLGRYGNTAAASIPITLDDAVRQDRLAPGDLVLMVAIGGGMTWASALLRWGDRPARCRRGAVAERAEPVDAGPDGRRLEPVDAGPDGRAGAERSGDPVGGRR